MAILVFEHSDRSGVGRFGHALRNYGHKLRIVRLHLNEPIPVDLDDVDGVVSCGGPDSANDDSLPWIERELELLRTAAEADMPVVGLCLGSQLLARALGGDVGVMDQPEVGWHEVRLSPVGREDPIYAGVAWNSRQAHWHHDHVLSPPAGARVLASSSSCKVQAWARGLRCYAFQYHPEIDQNGIDAFAADDPQALQQSGLTLEELRKQTQKHYPTFARLADRLFESIALLLMPVDRRYRGLVKDLHH